MTDEQRSTTHDTAKLEASDGFYRVHALTAVHKKDSEGVLLIDTLTGEIKQPLDERPEWAAGLAIAHLAERLAFYSQRLGPDFTNQVKFPQLLAFEDLQWEQVSEDGSAFITMLADDEHRMEVLAAWAGVERTNVAAQQLNDVPGSKWQTTGRAFIHHDADDHVMEEGEARAFADAEVNTFARQQEIDEHAAKLEAVKRKVANG